MEDENKKQALSEKLSVKDSADKKTIETKKESGGPKGLEPTRYGDWEKGGRCVDF
jgi:hypothetical protein